MIYRSIYIGLIIFYCAGSCLAQRKEPLPVNLDHQLILNIRCTADTTITLPNSFIIPGSEVISIDSVLLKSDSSYTLDARFGILKIKHTCMRQLFVDSSLHRLKVLYQSLPFNFKSSYQHRVPIERIDTITGEKVSVAQPVSPFSFDDIFSSNLQKSGSIVRGFTIGSNRDLSLNSGFRMQMNGNITNDIEIVASLTDENSPIQPEGTTQTLQEVDKVFVDIRSSNFGATLGDFNLNLSGNEFGNFSRKLQGAQGTANYRAGNINGDVLLLAAATRGKYTTNQFLGIDGVQGPYQLSGENFNRSIIVVAGTERVYVNGEQMVRGENGDYTIDYSISEITFTPKRLITHGSRIVVDFEYNDRQYNRNILTAKSGTNFLNDKFRFNAMFVQESDNEKSPVDISFNESDKKILRDAGTDRSKAVKSGIDSVGIGRGQYRAVDSTFRTSSGGDTLLRVYVYAPEDTMHAIYSITFTNVGLGNGNYKKISIGHYEFVGVKKGNYDHIRYLPLPQERMFTDLDFNGKLSEDLQVNGEYALMKFNQNKFASKSSNSLNGSAIRFGVQYSPSNVRIGSADIGSFDISIKERYIDKRFIPLDRINDVEFDRKWNINDSLIGDEEIREGSLSYQPMEVISVASGVGWIKRGDYFKTKRYNLSAKMSKESFPKFDYKFEKIITSDHLHNRDGNWIRQSGIIEYGSGIFIPRIKGTDEYLSRRTTATKSMLPSSYRFDRVTPGISISRERILSLDAEIDFSWEDSLNAGTLQRASRTVSHIYSAQLREWHSISSRLDFTVQNRNFTSQFTKRNNINAETILLRWQSQINPYNRGVESEWFYEVATERTSKMERVFQRVAKGFGNYRYIGDVNGNHIIDQPDFVLSRFDGDYITFLYPSDQLIPVIDVKASARIHLTPEKIFPSNGWFNKALTTLSSETFFRVEEKSTEPDRKQIYLLHFSKFQSDRTTLNGDNQFTQDIFFMENNSDISLRFRYSQHKGSTQYSAQSERIYAREKSVRLRWQMNDIASQTDYINKNDILFANQVGNRARNIVSNTLVTNWSYRPEQAIEFGFKFSVAHALNFDTASVDRNDQSVRLVYSIVNIGQVRAEFTREEITLTKVGTFPPYELTDGWFEGKTWLWDFTLEYRFTKFIQATINYEGRSEQKSSTVHIGRAEVRAFF